MGLHQEWRKIQRGHSFSDSQKAEKHRFLMDHPVPSISDRSTMNWIMISAASSLPKIPKARTFPMQP